MSEVASPSAPKRPRLDRLAALTEAAARGERWLRERLTQPPRPLAAVEVRARAVGVMRVTREGSRLALGAAASLDLPPGALRLSMTESNLADPAAFTHTLRAALERAGALEAGRVGLVLPDPVARVALVPQAELPDKGRTPNEEMIRFKLRKSVPFEIREAKLAFAAPGGRSEEPIVVAAIFKPVLEAYEAACRAVGVQPGIVELAGLALLSTAFGALPAADRLLVNWDEGYVTLLLARGPWPIVVRTLVGPAAAEPADVAREVEQTVLYYRERLGGPGLEKVVVRSAAIPSAQALRVLEPALGFVPEVLEPLEAMRATGVDGASQALAGAAACLAGSRP